MGIQLLTPTRVGVRPVIKPVRDGEQLELAAVILMNVDIRLVLGQPARVGGHMGAQFED